jgi:membrane protease YdiL (CAAX protease family)
VAWLPPQGNPARLRESDLLPGDQPFKPEPPLHRWRYSSGVRLLAFAVAAGVVWLGLLCLGFIGPIAGLAARHWWLLRLAVLAAAVAAYAVLLWVEQRNPIELAPRRWAGLGWGLLLGTGLCSAVFGILYVAGAYRVLSLNPGYHVLPAFISTGLVAAVAEEIAFRGVLFRLSEDLFGTWAAVAVTAVVFGVAHLSNPGATLWGAVAIALEAGVLFAALYVVTRSLWWCMGVHFAWNMLQGPVFGSVVSGSGSAAGWLRAEFQGPAWLTGGQFGIEASVVSVVLLTSVSVWLLLVVRRERLAVRPGWARRHSLRPTGSGNQLAA